MKKYIIVDVLVASLTLEMCLLKVIYGLPPRVNSRVARCSQVHNDIFSASMRACT